MAAVARDPLALRPLMPQVSPSPQLPTSLRKTSSVKRARSPDPYDSVSLSAKRPKPDGSAQTRDDAKREKERKRAEREREFRDKYSRAFPNFHFYFNGDMLADDAARLRDSLVAAVMAMGAVSSHLLVFPS